jgi:hypothetical protein
MQSYINMSNINAQLKRIGCSNTTKLPIKKISLYSPPVLLHHSANVKPKEPYVGQIRIGCQRADFIEQIFCLVMAPSAPKIQQYRDRPPSSTEVYCGIKNTETYIKLQTVQRSKLKSGHRKWKTDQ